MSVAAEHDSTPLIALEKISVDLGGRQVLEDISLKIHAGEFVVILGPNGVGKSTLLRAIAGLTLVRGGIEIQGAQINRISPRQRGSKIAYLPQGGGIGWPMSVQDVVALARLPFDSHFGNMRAKDHHFVFKAMEDCDLTALASRPVSDLSGGERARVLFARMLAVNAPIILADEPVASFDPAHQIGAMRLLAREAKQGQAVIAVLHDVALALRYATRIIGLFEGRVIADENPDAFLRGRIMDRLYGLRFDLAALPSGVLTPVAGV